jgi:hypothetical protein
MHEPKRFLIAAAFATLSLCDPSAAQKGPVQMDAAQKSSEGSIDHWIEFYKSQQRNTSPALRQGPTDSFQQPQEAVSKPAGKAPTK